MSRGALAQRRHAQHQRVDAVVEVGAEAASRAPARRGRGGWPRRGARRPAARRRRRARRKRFSSSTLSSLGCSARSMSPISSRKRVPRCATSSSPFLSAMAPVKAPFAWPNSSLSSSSRERPAQLMSTKASSARGAVARAASGRARPCRCRSRPGSAPGCRCATASCASAASAATPAVVPRKGSGAPRSSCDRRAAWSRRRVRWLSSVRSMSVTSAASSGGLVRKCSAPSLTVRTARSIEPWPVSTISGTSGSAALRRGIRSRASPSGSIEVEHREVGAVVAERRLAAGERRRLLHLVAVGLEVAPDRRAHRRLVVDEEDLRLQSRRAYTGKARRRDGGRVGEMLHDGRIA